MDIQILATSTVSLYVQEFIKHAVALQKEHTFFEVKYIDKKENRREIFDQIYNADKILCFVTSDFLFQLTYNSFLSYLLAKRRQEPGSILPFIVSQCDWENFELFTDLKRIGGRESILKNSKSRDQVYYQVIVELKTMLQQQQEKKQTVRKPLHTHVEQKEQKTLLLLYPKESGALADKIKTYIYPHVPVFDIKKDIQPGWVFEKEYTRVISKNVYALLSLVDIRFVRDWANDEDFRIVRSHTSNDVFERSYALIVGYCEYNIPFENYPQPTFLFSIDNKVLNESYRKEESLLMLAKRIKKDFQ